MKNLVTFIIVLALVGIILVLAVYFAVDHPLQQAALHAPSNNFKVNAF